MKFILALIMAASCASCFEKSEVTDSSIKQKESLSMESDVKEIVPLKVSEINDSNIAPKLSDFPRECPEAWGMVKGASQAKVESFIQNYFHVPENPTPMYSEINHFSQAGGAALIKAGTYKMQDEIVDQEMVVVIVAGKMTQCGARLRCASNPSVWVESCD